VAIRWYTMIMKSMPNKNSAIPLRMEVFWWPIFLIGSICEE